MKELSPATYPPMPPPPACEQERLAAEDVAPQHRLAKAIGAGGIILGVGLVGSAIGAHDAASTPTHIKIGPHNATLQLTSDHRINIDAGPFGHLDKQVSLPFDAGLSVRIEGIPASHNQTRLITSSGNLVSQYASLGDQRELKSSIEDKFLNRLDDKALKDGLEGLRIAIELLGGGAAAWSVMSEKRKQAIKDALSIESTRVKRGIQISALAGAMALAGCTAAVAMPKDHVTKNPNPQFVGTPLEGFATHGLYLDYAVDTIVPMANREINGIQAFSDIATRNLDEAFNDTFGSEPIDHDKYVVVEFISDNHCGIAMNEFHAEDAKLFDADATIDSGDMVPGGLPTDNVCVNFEVDPIVKHNPLYVLRGNHGSPSTLRHAQNRGAIILDNNQVIKLPGGLTVAGQGDVMESTFGSKIKQRGSETAQEEAEAIKAAACQNHPDVIVGHEPKEVLPTAEAGCAELVEAGHTHNYQRLTLEYSPTVNNTPTTIPTVYMNAGTSSGAAKDSFTVGTPTKTATEEECLFEKAAPHYLAGCYKIETGTNGLVTISTLQTAPGTDPSEAAQPILASK